MKWWPASLQGRLAVAFAAAVATVWVLHVFVTAADRRAAAQAPRVAPQHAPAPLPNVTFRVDAVQGPILLASRIDAVPPDAAPVIDVLASGGAFVRRPATAVPAPTAAILLPARSLAALSPNARGTLLELLGALVSARPVPADRVRLADVAAAPRELAALLAWVP